MLLQRYLQTSRSLAKLATLGDIRQTSANESITSKFLGVICDRDSSSDQIYSAALAAIAPSSPMVVIQGGALPKRSEIGGRAISDFEIGKFPVTLEEWQGIRNWALENGFELAEGGAKDSHQPINAISWHDALKWCNAKSLMEGVEPVYSINSRGIGVQNLNDKEIYRTGEAAIVHFNEKAKGYRLPTEAEWEWAARGGKKSKGYKFSGSDSLKAVGWYSDNSGGKLQPVGKKIANELDLYDMSGNVLEWCCDKTTGSTRTLCGGSWKSNASECDINHRFFVDPSDRNINNGFRLARSL
jgi:formylglycine-generating enzyme required for sulfatase activity